MPTSVKVELPKRGGRYSHFIQPCGAIWVVDADATDIRVAVIAEGAGSVTDPQHDAVESVILYALREKCPLHLGAPFGG